MVSTLLGLAALTTATLLPPHPHIETPGEAYAHAASGVGYVGLVIAPDGRVDGCTIRLSDGTMLKDRTPCTTLRHARATPATADGQPVYGTAEVRFAWEMTTDGDRTKPVAPDAGAADMALTVRALPDGMMGTPRSVLTLLVAADGKVEACEVAQSSGSSALDQAACGAARSGGTIRPLADAKGEAVKGVQPMSVEFAVQKR